MRVRVLMVLLVTTGCVATYPPNASLQPQIPPAALPTTCHAQLASPKQLENPEAQARSADTDQIITPASFQPIPPPRPLDPGPAIGANPPSAPKPTPPIGGSPVSRGGPLSLDEVLFSVERNYPLLRAIEQERAIAGGRLVSAMGAFDTNLLASIDGQGTTYDNIRTGVGLTQAIPYGGLGLFAGYRNGYGDFPTYNLGQKTAEGGEFRVGASIPLLRDRAIDRPRAAVQQARLDVAIAEPVIETQRLAFQRAAALTYWNWVAAGQRLKIVANLVELAAERDEQLKRQVAERRIANIERIDNQQNLALRNGVLVQAQRAFQQATIELSLFLRDETGQPTLADIDRLPEFPPVQPVDLQSFDAALQTAFELRPEPRRLRLQRDRVAVDLQLAQNQTLPGLNAVVSASQDTGSGKSSLSGPNGLDRSTVSAGVAFQLPIQLRDARGRIQVAQAQLTQLEQQLRQAEDVVRAEVQDAYSALERAYEFYQQAKQRVELARLVAQAERVQLRLGRSDVLRVTLREQAAFDAEILEITAQQDYFRALAILRAVLGIGAK
jgi:outer membrane protein TolC